MSSSDRSAPTTPKWGSRSVEIFEKIDQVGEGTFGKVYLAKSKQNGELVALKKVIMDNEREGFPITAIREIKLLKELDHRNIVKLKEIVTSKPTDHNRSKGSIYMVFEYLHHDLTGLLENGIRFSEAQVKCLMKQILEGLAYIHRQHILHRDIKCSNLLVSSDGFLKIGDFGLARLREDPKKDLTNRVVTLWYRAPELLLGDTHYDAAVDMWSVGCILAELFIRRPLLPGKSELDQLEKIFNLCGSPDETSWRGVSELRLWDSLRPRTPSSRKLRQEYRSRIPATALDLIEKLLVLDPKQRMSAKDALLHDFFFAEPKPVEPLALRTMLSSIPSSHEFQAKKRRSDGGGGAKSAPVPPSQPQTQPGGGVRGASNPFPSQPPAAKRSRTDGPPGGAPPRPGQQQQQPPFRPPMGGR